MSGARAIRAAAVTAIVTVLSWGAARADTFLFTDTLRPGGAARSEVAFHADEHRCGADARPAAHPDGAAVGRTGPRTSGRECRADADLGGAE